MSRRAAHTALLAALLGCGSPEHAPPAPEGAVAGPAVPLRRLNRHEIRRSLEDLFGVTLDLDTVFPADGLVNGLDNQAAGLVVTELLVERLDALAADLAAEATARVRHDAPVQAIEAEHLGLAFGAPTEIAAQPGTWWLVWGETPALALRWQVSEAGRYRVRALAFSHWASGIPLAELDLRHDGRSLGARTVRATAEVPGEVTWELDLDPGVQTTRLVLTNGGYTSSILDPEAGLSDTVGAAVGLDRLELVGPLPPDEGAPGPVRARVIPCDPDVPREQLRCAESSLRALAERAWRRPVTNPEVQGLLRFVEGAIDAGRPFDDGLRTAIHALLLSPSFLLRFEFGEGPPDDSGARALSGHELATRLAYFLWSGPPDDALRACADAGDLTSLDGDCGLRAQVDRMLADGRALAVVERFGRQWLGVAAVPEPEDATDALLQAVLLDDGPLDGLLDPALADPTLATPDRPGGVLALRDALRATSDGDRSSPVRRGVLVASRLLCDPPSPPPADVPALEEGADDPLAQLDAHKANPACAGCHAGFDPYGELLEIYDAHGERRATYADGAPVPDRATLPDGSEVHGVDGLVDWLRRDPRVHACVVAHAASFAWGVGVDDAGPLVAELLADVDARGGTGTDVLRAIALHPAFRRLPVVAP